jgi:hypothetical protein
MILLVTGTGFILIFYIDRFKDTKTRFLFAAFSVFFTYGFLMFVNYIYALKGGQADYSFWPPAHYQRGPLMVDQGTTV